eukprot:scaffold3136_cov102-Cylindrotheca_fusiformis.AAC.11
MTHLWNVIGGEYRLGENTDWGRIQIGGEHRLGDEDDCPPYIFYEMRRLYTYMQIARSSPSKKTLWESRISSDTLTRIGQEAFAFCPELEFVQFISNASSLETYPNASSETCPINPYLEAGTTIALPERPMLEIEQYAFSGCRSLQKVIFSSFSPKLGKGVFMCYTGLMHCSRLISVELPEGLQVIEEELFYGCKSLRTVKIPSSVTEICERAFCYCSRLTSFDLPHGLLKLGGRAFENCYSIKNVHLPSTASLIGPYAFANCFRLESISLPPSLETIEYSGFERCSSLSHIRIPPSIKRIGHGAFSNCRNLISIELPEDISLSTDQIEECESLVNVAVPKLRATVLSRYYLPRTKLVRVAGGRYDDLVCCLEHRFGRSPVNELCYYQSYHSSEDAMLLLRSLMEDDPLAAVTQVDEFGMTPLHILSLSRTLNVDMLLTVKEAGPVDHIVRCRDSFGSSPMDYLCLNQTPSSTDVIRRVLATRFDYWLGLDRSSPRSDAMWQAVDEVLAVDSSSKSGEIGRVYYKLAMYEQRMPFLSLLDLCLWKIKIEEACCSKEVGAAPDRQSCRMNSGASIVLSRVLPFLDKPDVGDYVVSSPTEQEEGASDASSSGN